MEEEVRFKLKELPKGDLHLHLNGLFNTEDLLHVLTEEKTVIPSGFKIPDHLSVLSPADSLMNYLKPWDVLRLLPVNEIHLEYLIDRAFARFQENNISFVELRSSLIYLAIIQNKSIENALILLIEKLKNASEKYNIKSGLILTIQRAENSITSLHQITQAYSNIGKPKEVIGIDLSGLEDYQISEDLPNAFRKTKEKFGLSVTIHAGETGNTQNIINAVKLYDADRIGHGTAGSLHQETMELLAKNDICVEVCPISNQRTGALNGHNIHPLHHFLKHNVPFVISSDNPGIHKATLTDDYIEAYKEIQDMEIFTKMFSEQRKYSFIKW